MTKVLYNISGINQEGYKDILGFYVAESEGASFWLGILNDLKQRSVQDILIACVYGQKISRKWTLPLANWALTISQLDIYFEGRIKLNINA